jgi:hypothetical protein
VDVRFRQWEKTRRDRFNTELHELAKCCSQDENEAALAETAKWSKQLVVQKAIEHIRLLERLRMPPDVEKRIRMVKRQNRKLRVIIREELGLEDAITEAQLVQLNLKEIREKIAEANKNRPPPRQKDQASVEQGLEKWSGKL